MVVAYSKRTWCWVIGLIKTNIKNIGNATIIITPSFLPLSLSISVERLVSIATIQGDTVLWCRHPISLRNGSVSSPNEEVPHTWNWQNSLFRFKPSTQTSLVQFIVSDRSMLVLHSWLLVTVKVCSAAFSQSALIIFKILTSGSWCKQKLVGKHTEVMQSETFFSNISTS